VHLDRRESIRSTWTGCDRDTSWSAADGQATRVQGARGGRSATEEEPAADPTTAVTGGEAQDARGENAQEAPETGEGGGHRLILTVTLNAAIDRTVAVPSFRQGHRHRAVEASTVAGGKGVNVARALKLLDRPVIATGLAGGPTG